MFLPDISNGWKFYINKGVNDKACIKSHMHTHITSDTAKKYEGACVHIAGIQNMVK